MATGGVIVWEWQNEFGSWRPYSSAITHYIEQNCNNSTPFSLGPVDPSKYQYAIDTQTLCQIRQGTGTQRKIRRKIYPPTSSVAKGITLQWMGDAPGQWHDYDIDIATYIIDNQYTSQIDLSKSPFGQPYIIDLNKMTQMRIETQRVRQIQRSFTAGVYPQALNSSSASSSSFSHSSNTLSTGLGSKRKSSNKNLTLLKKSKAQVTQSSSAFVPYTVHSTLNAAGHHHGLNNPAFTSTSTQGPTGPVSFSGSGLSHVPGQSTITTTQPGPLTRRRYHQTVAANSNQSGPSQPHGMLQFPGSSSSLGSLALPQQMSYPQGQSHVSLFPNNQVMFGYQPQAFGATGQLGGLGTGQLMGGGNVLLPNHLAANASTSTTPSSNFMYANNSMPAHTGGVVNPQAMNLLGRPNHSRIQPVLPVVTTVLGSTTAPGLFGNLQQQQQQQQQQQTPYYTQSSGQSPSSHSSPWGSTLPKHGRICNKAPKGHKGGKKVGNHKSVEDIFSNFVTVLTSLPEEEDCCICCEALTEGSGYATGGPEDRIVIQLEKCSHIFHKLCLAAMYDSGSKDGHLQCPTCKTIYGEKQGNCPWGEMEYKLLSNCLAGYEGHNTIQILYHIPPGIQGPEHPHPGHRFSTRGFPRIGYLPDNEKGTKALQLLILGWKRRLTFTIGMSTTTGEGDTVTWNEIHHKTELGTNYSGHGYPDPNYLDNVLLELAVHGITEADLPT